MTTIIAKLNDKPVDLNAIYDAIAYPSAGYIKVFPLYYKGYTGIRDEDREDDYPVAISGTIHQILNYEPSWYGGNLVWA